VRRRALFTLVLLTLPLAACGGSGGSGDTSGSSSSTGKKATSLVAKVENADASIEGKSMKASVTVTVGGHAGQHLVLRYGIVDAVSGVRASEEERLVKRYTTTETIEKKEASVTFPTPTASTEYLVHFVLYAQDGSYLASSDSPIVTVH
jgi:hypothetical protein